MQYLSTRLNGFGTTIFAEMTALAQRFDATNLGQGFPDFDTPDFVKRAAIRAIEAGRNQYCRTHGVPELTSAIAEHQKRFWGLSYDPETEITVYSGATEAIAATLQALCNAGDEVVLFEPFYDSYRASVAMAGAVDRVVTLGAPDFALEAESLERAITPRTRVLLLNSPHNPTGKVFSRAELELVAATCKRYDLVLVTDEVYEHLVFEGQHVPLASLPGMRERTVLISSAGKSFSVTGWKVGYTCAPPELTRAVRTAHQFITFCTSTPFQYALAEAYRAPDAYFEEFRAGYLRRRDLLCRGLAHLGFEVIVPAGTYFALTDIRPVGFTDDVEFCTMLPEKARVAAIPVSAFSVNKAEYRHLVRWAFCKSETLIEEALRRLGVWRKS